MTAVAGSGDDKGRKPPTPINELVPGDGPDSPFISIELVGGPQDGGKVRVHEDQRQNRIWIKSVWDKDEPYVAFTSAGATKKYPIEMFYEKGKYRYVRDTR